jgi:hypothetical protein
VAGKFSDTFMQAVLIMSEPLKPLFADLGGGLLKLTRSAADAAEFGAIVRESLPEALRVHVVTAVRRGDDLVVIVDSAAWAARVRYSGPRLQQQLLARGEAVTGKVRVRVGRPAVAGT